MRTGFNWYKLDDNTDGIFDGVYGDFEKGGDWALNVIMCNGESVWLNGEKYGLFVHKHFDRYTVGFSKWLDVYEYGRDIIGEYDSQEIARAVVEEIITAGRAGKKIYSMPPTNRAGDTFYPTRALPTTAAPMNDDKDDDAPF